MQNGRPCRDGGLEGTILRLHGMGGCHAQYRTQTSLRAGQRGVRPQRIGCSREVGAISGWSIMHAARMSQASYTAPSTGHVSQTAMPEQRVCCTAGRGVPVRRTTQFLYGYPVCKSGNRPLTGSWLSACVEWKSEESSKLAAGCDDGYCGPSASEDHEWQAARMGIDDG